MIIKDKDPTIIFWRNNIVLKIAFCARVLLHGGYGKEYFVNAKILLTSSIYTYICIHIKPDNIFIVKNYFTFI